MKKNKKESYSKETQIDKLLLESNCKVIKTSKTNLVTAVSFFIALLLLVGATVFYIINSRDVKVTIVGVDADSTVLELDNKATIKDIEIVQKSGYEFLGWYKDSAFTEAYLESDEIVSGMTIYAKYEMITYTISYPTSVACVITGATEVDYNSSVNFTIAKVDEYSDAVLTVKANGELLTLTDNGYTISNILEDIIITIEGVEVNTYDVTLPLVNNTYTITAGNTEVEYGSNFNFSITLSSAYNVSTPTVYVNNSAISYTSNEEDTYYYQVQNITSNITISVDTLSINQYGVQVTNCNGCTAQYDNSTLSYGDNFEFTLSVDEHYEGTISVTNNGSIISPLIDGGYTYRIENVTTDINIVTTGLVAKQYAITWVADEVGYTLSSKDTNITHFEQNGFDITLLSGYNTDSLSVYATNGTITRTGYHFVLSNVSANTAITVSGVEINSFGIVFPTDQTGYSIAYDSANCDYGSDFEFTCTILDGYTQSVPSVYMGETLLSYTSVSGNVYSYKIENVTDSYTIIVNDVSLNTYSITYPTGAGYTITNPTNTATHNGSATFTITLESGYVADNISVNATNGTLTSNGLNYTLSNITANSTISISGLALEVFSVTFTGNDTGYTKSGNANVTYADDYTFSVTLSTGYTDSSLVVKANDSALTPVSVAGSVYNYKVENITGDLTIAISNVELNTLSVSFANDMTGYSISNAPTSVLYGNNIFFTITLNSGYTAENINVSANNGTLSNTGLTYTVSNVTEGLVITITGIEEEVVEYTLTKYIDGVSSTQTVLDSDTLSGVSLLNENNCVGWYTDANFTNYVSMSTAFSAIASENAVTLYTKTPTLSKLAFTLLGDNTYMVYAVDGDIAGDVVIPMRYNNQIVSTIGDIDGNNNFSLLDITSVFIPDGVTTISYSAFSDNSSITSIRIGYGVQSIDTFAFSGLLNLTKIFIPSSVITIAGDSGDTSIFYYSDSIVIYTDAITANTGWDTYWNYYKTDSPLVVNYNTTYDNFLLV